MREALGRHVAQLDAELEPFGELRTIIIAAREDGTGQIASSLPSPISAGMLCQIGANALDDMAPEELKVWRPSPWPWKTRATMAAFQHGATAIYLGLGCLTFGVFMDAALDGSARLAGASAGTLIWQVACAFWVHNFNRASAEAGKWRHRAMLGEAQAAHAMHALVMYSRGAVDFEAIEPESVH